MKSLIIIIYLLSIFSCVKKQENIKTNTVVQKVGLNKKRLSSDNIDKSQRINDKAWQGTYHFEASNRDEAKTIFDITINSLEDISVNVTEEGVKKAYSKIKAETLDQEKIKINYNPSLDDMGTIYIEKSDAQFYISGSPIYFINPGNNEMPLQKVK